MENPTLPAAQNEPSSLKFNSPKEVLIAARKKIEKEEKWVRGGAGAGLDDCHCCQTAISAVVGTQQARPALVVFARQIGGTDNYYLSDIWHWNDDPTRTHAEVLAAFDKAIEAAP